MQPVAFAFLHCKRPNSMHEMVITLRTTEQEIRSRLQQKLEMWAIMPNVMAALPNIGGALG